MTTPPRIYWKNADRLVRAETQKEIDRWFWKYKVSFNDPTRFATVLHRLNERVRALEDLDTRPKYNVRLSYTDLTTMRGSKALTEILREIAELRSHRHRMDALSILHEVYRRTAGEKPRSIMPTPLNPGSIPTPRDPDELKRPLDEYEMARRRPVTAEEIASTMPEWDMDDTLPGPWIREKTNQLPPPDRGMRNRELQETLSTQFSNDPNARASIVTFLSTGALNPGRVQRTYLDNPAEILRDMPHQDRVPIISGPILPGEGGETPEEIISGQYDITNNEEYWPTLDILDLRRGSEDSCGYLEESDYIYQLVALVRRVLSQPEVARNYVWICRAHPSRYQNDTEDRFEDEGPPTAEEVACIMALLRMTFPEIVISPTRYTPLDDMDTSMSDSEDTFENDKSSRLESNSTNLRELDGSSYNTNDYPDDDSDEDYLPTPPRETNRRSGRRARRGIRRKGGIEPGPGPEGPETLREYAHHNRFTNPTQVKLNGVLFDMVENMYYERRPIGHIFYLIFVVLSHELAHYLNTCIWIREQERLQLDLTNNGNNDTWYNLIDTPRGMRWLVSNATAELTESENYSRWAFRVGEMGEVIEWSLYNYIMESEMSNTDLSKNETLYITCWGSYPFISERFPELMQLEFSAFAGTQLFRTLPPIRMESYDAIQSFISRMAAAERLFNTASSDTDMQSQPTYSMQELLQRDYSVDIEMSDPDALFTGYDLGGPLKRKRYRRATQSIRWQQWKAQFDPTPELILFPIRKSNIVYGQRPPLIPPGGLPGRKIRPFLLGYSIAISTLSAILIHEYPHPGIWGILSYAPSEVCVLFIGCCILPTRIFFKPLADRKIYTAAVLSFLFLTFGGPGLIIWGTEGLELWTWMEDYEYGVEIVRSIILILCILISSAAANFILKT
ncbi:hypothetical protein DFP73DRAFT_582041 [Morchella snyderi]|nr:hypothetical protein DFP73DRAFT_582041 [Morchella snyderi]